MKTFVRSKKLREAANVACNRLTCQVRGEKKNQLFTLNKIPVKATVFGAPLFGAFDPLSIWRSVNSGVDVLFLSHHSMSEGLYDTLCPWTRVILQDYILTLNFQ